jgi:hypothetical protein
VARGRQLGVGSIAEAVMLDPDGRAGVAISSGAGASLS